MNLDLILLGVVIFFGILGAFTGVARQVGHLVGLVAAYFSVGPLSEQLAPHVSLYLRLTQTLGQIASRFIAFLVVFLTVRWVLTALIKRLLGDKDDGEGSDRLLGFALGAVKSAALLYVFLCALSYAEDNILVAGKSLGLAPKESRFFNAARRFNLFDMTQFSQVKELTSLMRLSVDPKMKEILEEDPNFQDLEEDPRLRKLMQDAALRDSMKKGDYKALLENHELLKLLKDTDFTRKLGEIAESAERRYADLP